MTYRGIVSNGTVIMDGDDLADGTIVDVTPRLLVADQTVASSDHPAFGLWENRDDLPADSVEASKVLRQKLMRRNDE